MSTKSSEELYAERQRVNRQREFEPLLQTIPERYRGFSFRKILPKHPKIKMSNKRWEEVVHSIDEYTDGPTIDNGLILLGPPATGKTTLLACILRKIAIKQARFKVDHDGHGYSMVWIDMGSWAEQILNYNNPPAFSLDRMRTLQTPVHLFLDEFDKVPDTEAKQGYVNSFFRTAYDKNCPMFLASNITLEEFEKADLHVTRRINEDGDNPIINLYNTGL